MLPEAEKKSRFHSIVESFILEQEKKSAFTHRVDLPWVSELSPSPSGSPVRDDSVKSALMDFYGDRKAFLEKMVRPK